VFFPGTKAFTRQLSFAVSISPGEDFSFIHYHAGKQLKVTSCNSREQLTSAQETLACNDSSHVQQTERFTAGTTWKLARISSQVGFVVRYLGLSATPPEFAERLLAEIQKNPRARVPSPRSLAFKVCRFYRRAD